MQLRIISKKNWVFTIIVSVLLFINLSFVLFADLQSSRLARLVTVAFLFIFYLSRKQYKNSWVKAALIFFLIHEIFFQFYEYSIGLKGYVIVGCLAYMMVIVECFRKFSIRFFNTSFVILGALLLIVNMYMLYSAIEILNLVFRDSLDIALYYLYGSFMMIMAVIAVAYNTKYYSTRSLRYTLLVFCFLFSDVSALFAYYFDFELCYMFSLVFFILALSIFVTYGLNYEIEREENYQYEMIHSNEFR
ncbi:hypothetical protein [Flavimarina sp. Hel_I_48]|uniref:hypothetical protein n=1 Tax=Flavimarina sp. Hel_I_48 TaxID=1392488 RepID=UPI0004DFC688|nr:hypothetical protein [Flavimarina sp. Hel_I_48]